MILALSTNPLPTKNTYISRAMKKGDIALLVSGILGLAFLIPGIVLLYQSTNCDDEDDGCGSSDADIPLTVVGAILFVVAIAGACTRSTKHRGGTDTYVNPELAANVRYWGDVGQQNGNAMAQASQQQAQWQAAQQQQMQWSINNPS